jgi:glycosyltransferase involved in cell wall biosynthesis
MTKISVIIPMYNVASYLKKCLESVYQQNFQEDDFEVILVDDESPDNSLTIAKKLTKDYANTKIISQKNKGLGGARNTGIEIATGEYILFLDADDWYLPNTLKQVLQKAKNYSLEILEFGAQGVNMNNKIVYTKSLSSENVLTGIEYYQKYRYMDSACNKLYKRSFLLENELLFIERLYIEDYEFNTRVFYKAQKVMATDLITAQFLQSPDSITRSVDGTKQLKMREDIVTVIKETNSLYYMAANKNELLLEKYFEQRLGYLTTTLFYQLFKSSSSYNDFISLKERLKKEKIFYVNFSRFDKGKEWFTGRIFKFMQKVDFGK